MNPETWKTMIQNTRELELSLGEEEKIENNESETVVLQRRALRAKEI